MGETKYCGCCKKILPVNMFAKNAAKKDGVQERCTPCRKAFYEKHKDRIQERVKKNRCPKKEREKRLEAMYKITQADYEVIAAQQGNRCAICGEPNKTKGKPLLAIDHCHIDGKIRGLLCDRCNTGLGLFRDNVETLTSAIEYLKRS